MGDQWFFAQDGRRSGPVRRDELQELAGSGRLQPYDLVREGQAGSWKPARQVEGLTFSRKPARPCSTPTASPPPSSASPLRPEWAWLEREAVPDLQAPGFLHPDPVAEPEAVARPTPPEDPADPQEKEKEKERPGGPRTTLLNVGAGLVAVLVCGAVGRVAAVPGITPLIGGLVGLVLLRAVAGPLSRVFVPALAVLVGQGVWLAAPGVVDLARGTITPEAAVRGLLPDGLVLAVGLLWLLLGPGTVPVVVLCTFQVLGLVKDGLAFALVVPGSEEWKLLVVQLALRGLALAFLAGGLLTLKRAVRRQGGS